MRQAHSRHPAADWLRPLVRPGLLLCGLLVAGLLIRALPGVDRALFSRELLRDGLHGRVVFLCIGTLICAVGLPRQAVGFAAGFAYGSAWGVALATIANLVGCAGHGRGRATGRGASCGADGWPGSTASSPATRSARS